MRITYEKAPDLEEMAKRIVSTLSLRYIDQSRLHFYRSKGSKSRRVQARIHGMGRIWFDALGMRPHYIIEVISEEFDRLANDEKEKAVIHELMHIPTRFSGGFVPHRGKINKRSVDKMHRAYQEASAYLQIPEQQPRVNREEDKLSLDTALVGDKE